MQITHRHTPVFTSVSIYMSMVIFILSMCNLQAMALVGIFFRPFALENKMPASDEIQTNHVKTQSGRAVTDRNGGSMDSIHLTHQVPMSE